jgi:ribonuclease HI
LTETNRFDTYLGLPALIGKSKLKAFNSIKEKVEHKLSNWKVKFLSQAGKEVLLKAVVQGIPTYSMSVFLLPASLCKDLNRLMQHFFWKHMANSSGIDWMSWEKMGRAKKIGGLGFRDLNCFNKALLAKQDWRLCQNPSSLIGSILKAKYFPNSSFLEAPLGKRPSYAWRSIFSARNLLQRGLIWRVGNGSSINIWRDRWIPTPTSYSVQSPPALHFVGNRVLALIDRDSKSWKWPLLQPLFNPVEAKVIASIPLSSNLPPDRLIWLDTKNGNFSVRSAYHLGLEIKDRERGQSSNDVEVSDVWRSIWNLQVPNKIKMFLWRACNDILPTRENLLKKRVIVDGKCPWCNIEEESTAHALWFCPAAKDVWNVGHSIFQKCAFIEHNFLEIFQLCLTRFDRDEMAFFAAIARRIWLRRNSMVFEGVSEHPNKTYMDAITVVEDFKRCLKDDKVESSSEQVQGRSPLYWQTPPEDTIKVNFDAAINKNTGFIGLGLIARDHKGYLLGAKCLTKSFLTDAHTVELMAASYAVNFCSEVGLFNVIFEGDALNVIREVNSNPPFLSRSGHFVEGSKQDVYHLRSFAFVHIPRVLNEAAHTLAKSAAASLCDDVWLEDIPACILDIVTREQQVPRS